MRGWYDQIVFPLSRARVQCDLEHDTALNPTLPAIKPSDMCAELAPSVVGGSMPVV